MPATMRDAFLESTGRMLQKNPDSVVVLADIGVSQFREAGLFKYGGLSDEYSDRFINCGIREQLMIGVAAGLAKEGFRPLVHSYAPFLIERPYEQIKIDFAHLGLGGVFVSVGASFDASNSGRTHQAPGDVGLLKLIPDFEIHVPGHADEAAVLLDEAAAGDGRVYVRLSEDMNSTARPVEPGKFHVERQGSSGAPAVIAVGPMLDRVLEATEALDVTVLYATTVMPFDSWTLRDTGASEVVPVEPYLLGTSAAEVSGALHDRPHRLMSLGVRNMELRNYGTLEDHIEVHGLDAESLRDSISGFLAK
ncbi:transketolase family protein [Candidatus Lucifugimonas marina]